MSIKEYLKHLSKEKKNAYYWAGIFLVIDLFLTVQNSWSYTQTGMCKNYMIIGSQLHSCTTAEFIKNGWAWLSFTNVLIFLPAALTMIFASRIVDIIFARTKS